MSGRRYALAAWPDRPDRFRFVPRALLPEAMEFARVVAVVLATSRTHALALLEAGEDAAVGLDGRPETPGILEWHGRR